MLDASGDVIGLVVEHAIDAPAFAEFGFLLGADGGDRLGADRLGHLHDHGADAAGAAVDEDDLAGLQFRALEDAEMGRDADERDRGGLVIRDAGGRRVKEFLRSANELRARPLPAEQPLIGAPHALADLEAFDARADRVHGARDIGPGDERRRQRHLDDTGANVRVDRIERRGCHANADLARLRRRCRHVAVVQHVGSARSVKVSGFHEVAPPNAQGRGTPSPWACTFQCALTASGVCGSFGGIRMA